VYTHTNKPISEHAKLSRQEPAPYRYLVFGLNWDREKLYRRIEARVDKMIADGLVDEVRRLAEMGYDKGTTAMQAIGYKEVLNFLRGEYTLEETVEILKRDTRRYAKRQLTWFRGIREINWIDMDESTDISAAAKKIIDQCIATYGIIL
jgi:tRNA dimethylallyltransferase